MFLQAPPCPVVPNSTGAAAILTVPQTPPPGTTTLEVVDMPPSEWVCILASDTRDSIPNPMGSPGTFCLGGTVQTLGVYPTGEGEVQHMLDTTTYTAGATVYFQAAYRDGATFNFSNVQGVRMP